MSISRHSFRGRPAWAIVVAVAATAIGTQGGCSRWLDRHTPTAVPYTTTPPSDGTVDAKARRLNLAGVKAFEHGNLARAESLFREALERDVSFGPAHNNLGQIYLARHQLYLAAWEFEYAANLMPSLAEPIINQGLAYETGEMLDRAFGFYADAYERFPNHPIAIASLVRISIKQDGNPDEIAHLLDELILHDGRPDWVTWAKELRATKYRTSNVGCFDGDLDCEECEAGGCEIVEIVEIVERDGEMKEPFFPPIDTSSVPTRGVEELVPPLPAPGEESSDPVPNEIEWVPTPDWQDGAERLPRIEPPFPFGLADQTPAGRNAPRDRVQSLPRRLPAASLSVIPTGFAKPVPQPDSDKP